MSKDQKAAIRRASKEAKQPMGVYRIRMADSDKVFVDFAVDLPARFNRHKFELKIGSHRNKDLQKVWNVRGEAGLDFEVLDELERDEISQEAPNEELRVLAQMWLRKLEQTGVDVIALFNESS